MYDLVVIGGGPAGSAAAITAARVGFKVLLLERGRFPRQKVCGEFVSAESLQLLGSLLSHSDICLLDEAVRISRTRIFADRRILQGPVDPPAASIARIELDPALWRAAAASGVEGREQTTVNKVTGDGPFAVSTTCGDFEARTVINASGRWSNLSRTPTTGDAALDEGVLSHAGAQHRWIGLKGHFAESQPAPSVDLYFFEGGYCGVQPVALRDSTSNRVNVCAMVRAVTARNLGDVFSLNQALLERSQNWEPLMEPVATSQLVFRKSQATRDNILHAGDAATFVDPFIGDGISLALRSGALAAETLEPFLRNQQSFLATLAAYEANYADRFGRVFRSSSRIRGLLRWPKPIRWMALTAAEYSPALMEYAVRSTR
jgi:flavin-dependent dehydrogenase